MTSLDVRLYRNRELCYSSTFDSAVEIGRQRQSESGPFCFDEQQRRLIIAPADEQLISRSHLLIEPLTGTDVPKIKVTNLSRKRSCHIEVHGKLGPEQSVELAVPVLISFEHFAVRVEQSTTEHWELRSLGQPTLAPGSLISYDSTEQHVQRTLLESASTSEYRAADVMKWLTETMRVLHHAAGEGDYLAQAVRAIDRIIGLTTVAALKYEDSQWRIVAINASVPGNTDSQAPSQTILQELLRTKRTIFQVPNVINSSQSLQGVKALVASPILDANGNIIGALYGARYSEGQAPEITELEATLVEVVACSAAAGIAREVQQQKAMEARIKFEQFFTPQLARELESNPDLLDAQEADVSIMFCDIIGFSSISQHIGPQATMHWITDVMGHLSDVVLKHDGVVVDYIGDELLAMWGAPKPQADHAKRAVDASLDLMQIRTAIDSIWQSRLNAKTDLRIGICSGKASVGNTGSRRRLKYGPLGNTVNLASRLQSAAKYFSVGQLIGSATALAIADHSGVSTRPLGKTKLVNIATPVDVFELSIDSDQQTSLSNAYHELFDLVAAKENPSTLLKNIASEFPEDVPTKKLLARINQGLAIEESCVWDIQDK